MYTISKELRTKIVNNVMGVLEEEDYIYTKNAVNKIVDTWFERKNRLIDILSKHPNWNPEKFLIQFDQDYSREICTEEVHKFANWLFRELSYEDREAKARVIDFIYGIEEQFFDHSMDDVIAEINKYNEAYHLRNNMKSSKAIGKICKEEGWDKIEDYNKRYAALCDCLNPIKVKRHTCISLNPVDFLYMSNGTSWNSCHDIRQDDGEPGCYSGGTISYMLDENSFLFYTVDSDFDGNSIEYAPKLQREIFGYRDFVLFQSRLYPQSNDCGAAQIYKDIREIIQKVVSDCIGENNLWDTNRKDVSEIVSKGKHASCYPDWERGCPGAEHCHISKLRGKEEYCKEMILGAEPICINCGGYNHDHETITCCGKWYTCYDCGEEIRGEEVHWIDGRPFCDHCIITCEECGEEIALYDESEYYTTENGGYICRHCYETRGYVCCDHCGHAVRVDSIYRLHNGLEYCNECFENYCFVCDECEEIFRNREMCHDGDGHIYCRHCYGEITERSKAEEMVEERGAA